MPEYTTGEMARQCGVSVRTVQYYDTRGILTPSRLTEGGRRLYSQSDLYRLKMICFLRELNVPLNSIGELLAEEHPGNVISLILDEHQKALEAERDERQRQIDRLAELRGALKTLDHFSVESIGDIAYLMENKKKLRRVHTIMVLIGILMDCLEVGTAVFWYKTGIWWPFAVGMAIVVLLAVQTSRFYYRSTAYLCPKCHSVFWPEFKQAFWAPHTPTTRKLTCTACGYHGFCVETYREGCDSE